VGRKSEFSQEQGTSDMNSGVDYRSRQEHWWSGLQQCFWKKA